MMKLLNSRKTPLSNAIACAMLTLSVSNSLQAETVNPVPIKKDNAIEVIMVTAQKRVQSINEVGVAISAFSDDDIRDLGLTQPVDLAAETPNININNTTH